MLSLFIVLCVFTGIFRGIKEGMIMITKWDNMFNPMSRLEGVRGHEWFKYYHLISILGITFLITTGYVVLEFDIVYLSLIHI